MTAAFQKLQEIGSAHGFKLNMTKSAIYCNGLDPINLPAPLPQQLNRYTDRMEVLGGVIGSSTEVAFFLENKLNIIADESNRVYRIDNTQQKLFLLRFCTCQKFNYLMRLLNPRILLPDGTIFGDRVDEILSKYVFNLLHFERKESLDSFQWSQIRLPVNKGGLGILQAINTHHAAYIGSTIDCLEDMKSIHSLALTQPNGSIRNNNLYVSDNARVLYDELLYRFPADPGRGSTCLDNFDNI